MALDGNGVSQVWRFTGMALHRYGASQVWRLIAMTLQSMALQSIAPAGNDAARIRCLTRMTPPECSSSPVYQYAVSRMPICRFRRAWSGAAARVVFRAHASLAPGDTDAGATPRSRHGTGGRATWSTRPEAWAPACFTVCPDAGRRRLRTDCRPSRVRRYAGPVPGSAPHPRRCRCVPPGDSTAGPCPL